MESTYTVTGGQVGAMGNNAHAEGSNFSQVWSQTAANLELHALATELGRLRTAMRKDAVEPEHDQAVANIGAAEVAAKNQDGTGALKHLKSAGAWALDAATKIGTTVAAKAIQSAIGLP